MNPKNKSTLCIKTKIWIENESNDLLFGKGKTEILELIEQVGSIAKAAEEMGLNYRKAWSHIKILQENVSDELVVPQKGGGGKGGTVLTPRAKELIRNYRLLQQEIEQFSNRRFREMFLEEPDTRTDQK
jgi:molybdate transport repressor ModE-like protein